MSGGPGPRAPVRRCAWAKINLTLHVTGRRPDGRHELDSLVVFAGIGDRLELAEAEDRAGGLTLTMDGPFAASLSSAGAGPGAPENLVLRAARLLRARFGLRAGARLHLTKTLPVAAGLGGGSSDAAAALTGLAELWGLGVGADELAELGAELGADVPVCLSGRPSLVGGIGEALRPAPALPPAWLALVNPGVPLATAEVFRALRGPYSAPARWTGAISDVEDLAARLAAGRNDLEAVARILVPEIGDALVMLAATPGCLLARMSGSGASCFGLYAEREAAGAAAEAIGARRAAWWVAAAPVLDGASATAA